MQPKILILPCLLLLLSITSCYKDIDLDQYKAQPTLVLNCIVNPDTTILANISKSWFFTDIKPSENIPGLKVNILVNSTVRGMMTYKERMYTSNVRPKANDTVEIRTEVDGHTLSSKDVMPNSVSILSVDVSVRSIAGLNKSYIIDSDGKLIESNIDKEYTYKISFNDEANKENYYFLKLEDASSNHMMGSIDFSTEPLFRLSEEKIDGCITKNSIDGLYGLPFSDEGIDGKSYTLTIKEKGSEFFYNDSTAYLRKIKLYSISKSYYCYLISLLSSDDRTSISGDMLDLGMTEPTKVYSNIQGGIGIMGCLRKAETLVNLKEYNEASE